MILEESTTAQAARQAKDIASRAAQKAKRLAGVVNQSSECVTKALEEARGVREEIRNNRDQLQPVASSIVSQVQSRVQSLAQNVKEEAKETAQNTQETIGESSQRLATEALSAGLGTSTGTIGEIANQRIESAIEENIDRTFGEGTARALRRKGKKARKAAVAALDIIGANKSAFFRGVMGILVRRTERDLREMEERLVRSRRNLRTIRRGGQRALQAREALSSGDITPRIEEAAIETEGARRDLSIARTQYEQNRTVEKRSIESAGNGLSEASRLLASSRATKILRQALGTDLSSGLGILQEARNAAGQIGAEPIASLYGQVLTWGGLARTMNDTVAPAYGTAQLVKAGQTIRYVEGEAARIKTEIEGLEPSEQEKRAKIALELENLAQELGVLLQFAGSDDINEEQWFGRAASFFRRPFFASQQEQGRIERLEVFEQITNQIQGIADLEPRAENPIQATSTTIKEVRDVLSEARQLSDLYERSQTTVSVVAELLGSAGIENPIDSILRGTFSQEVQTIFAGASSILPSSGGQDCPDPVGLLPSDVEQSVMEARRKKREQARAATGAISAIAESNAVSAQRMAGLPT